MSDLFPELEGEASAESAETAPGDASQPTTTPGIVKLQLGAPGAVLRGETWSLRKWRQLFGLDRLRAGERRLSLDQVEVNLSDGHIAITFTGSRLGSVEVHLLPSRQEGSERLGVTVGLQGPVPSDAVHRLLRHTQRVFQRASYKKLLKLFRLDPEAHVLQVEALPDAEGERQGNRELEEIFERSVVRTHGGASQWHVFQAEMEQQRNFNHYLTGNIVVIKHEDLECCYATPPLRQDLISFFNYSASHLDMTQDSPPQEGEDRQPPQRALVGNLTTDLLEADVIAGGTAKAEAMLEALQGLPVKPDLVIAKTSCVPSVIGDDLQGVANRYEERSGVPTVFLDNLATEEADYFSTLLERLRWEPEFCHPEEKVGRVNLVGFPRNEEMSRLVQMLESLGVVINACLVPRICLEDITRYTSSELQVFYDSELYRQSFRQILGNTDIRSLYTTPPHGVAGSRRWITQVTQAVGDERSIDAVWDHAWAPFAETWARLTQDAAEHCLGFVLNSRGLELLLHPEKGTGIPILGALEEMGFKLEFLLHDQIPERPNLPGSVVTFSEAKELEELLVQSPAAAFYSEFYFDRRLSRCGKAQFSVSDFRLGLGGALETLRRLLRICTLPFYRRYGTYMGSAFGPGGGAP